MWRTLFEEKNKLRNLEIYIQNALNKTHTDTKIRVLDIFFFRNKN